MDTIELKWPPEIILDLYFWFRSMIGSLTRSTSTGQVKVVLTYKTKGLNKGFIDSQAAWEEVIMSNKEDRLLVFLKDHHEN